MAINEQIVSGRKFRKLIDESTKLWQRISIWTKSSDVEFDDGKTAETKVGAINGITDSLTADNPNIALSSKAGTNLQNQLNQLNTGIRYNSETDKVQIYYKGAWVNWKSGGMGREWDAIALETETFTPNGGYTPIIVSYQNGKMIMITDAQVSNYTTNLGFEYCPSTNKTLHITGISNTSQEIVIMAWDSRTGTTGSEIKAMHVTKDLEFSEEILFPANKYVCVRLRGIPSSVTFTEFYTE